MKKQRKISKDFLFILLIFTLAMSFRMIYFDDYKDTDSYPVSAYSDSYFYYIWAKDIASGDLLGNKAFMKWPFYAYFLGGLFKLFGENIAFIHFLQFLLGAINSLLVYAIAKVIFNERVAFIAGLLCAFYGLFIFYEGLLVYTSLSLFLNSLLFLFILKVKYNPRVKNLFGLGIFLGIATITQANILIFGVLAILWILWMNRLNWQRLVYNLSSFMLGLCIIIGSVTLANYAMEKDFVLIAGNLGFNFYSGNNPDTTGTFFCPRNIGLNQEDMFRDTRNIPRFQTGKELKTSEVSRFWFKKGVEFIRENPGKFLKLFFRKLGYVFSPREYIHDMDYHFILKKIRIFKIVFTDLRFVLPFGLLGMFLGLKRPKETALLYLVLGTLSLSISLFFVTTRYRITIVPFLMIFAAFGILSIWDTLKERRYIRFGLLSMALVTIFTVSNYDMIAGRKISVISRNNPLSHSYHYFKALAYEKNSDYENAIKELNLAHRISPTSHDVILRLGIVYYRMNDFKRAEEKFKETLKINPLAADIYYNLGFMYNEQNRFSEAKDMLEKAVFLTPDDAAVHFELGTAYKSIGEIEKAKVHFNLALKNTSRWRKEDIALIEKELSELDKIPNNKFQIPNKHQ